MTRNIARTVFPMLALAFTANADIQLISNGGFESGLTGWTVTSSATSGGIWLAGSGSLTPLTGNPTVGPDSGTGYAVTDQYGPGVNALSQDYTVPLGTTSLTLTFDMFIDDWAPATGSELMQVLILDAAGDPVTGAGTLSSEFSGDTLVTGGVPNPYLAFSYSIAGYVPGSTYILDFQETDNAYPMNVGVDNVSLEAGTAAAVPEPTGVALLLGVLAALAVFNWRRLGAIRHQAKLLLVFAAVALLGQSVYAQNPNVGYAVMPAASPDHSRSHAWVGPADSPALSVAHGPGQSCGVSEAKVCYYNPVDFNTAYATGSIAHANGGSGITVAIVDAFYNSQTEADLGVFSSAFGLPACTIASGCLTIVSQTGSVCPTGCSAPGGFDAEGWALETDLDIEAVHAIAPNANILLVTAASDFNTDLYTAVVYAYHHADVVTDSWGSNEFSGETSAEAVFSGSPVPVLFSAGDAGAVPEYPCMSAYTICVGGTKLLETATSFRKVETAWGTDSGGGGGGGCSAYITAPAFQSGFSTSDCGASRGAPDVSADADEYTGMNTYLGPFAALGLGSGCTPALCPAGGYVIGGTSLASPLTAGLIANIDADRVFSGKSKLGAATNSMLYAAGSVSYHYHFYDVTTGSTGFLAGPGWDDATGLGVSLGPALAFYLIGLP